MRFRLPLNKTSTAMFILGFAGLLAACGGNGQDSSESDNSRPKGRTLEYTQTVRFLDNGGEPVASVEVAVADEESERNMGLMDVNELPADKGMLFTFEEDAPRSFWMANTPLPLDIIFVNSEYQIVRIHHSTQPFSDKSLTSGEPARYAVETNAGFCITHDIQEGMRIDLGVASPADSSSSG